jgi:hypothetical protein
VHAAQEVRRPDVKPTPSPDAPGPIVASDILQRLHDEAPKDHFTLGWLMGTLHKRSFGVIMLIAAVVAVAPGISIVAGLPLMMTAVQMIEGHAAPVFPTRIAARPLPARHLAAVLQRSLPALRYLEQVAHPRWPMPHEATKRIAGGAVPQQHPAGARHCAHLARLPRRRRIAADDRPLRRRCGHDPAGVGRLGGAVRREAADRTLARCHDTGGAANVLCMGLFFKKTEPHDRPPLLQHLRQPLGQLGRRLVELGHQLLDALAGDRRDLEL